MSVLSLSQVENENQFEIDPGINTTMIVDPSNRRRQLGEFLRSRRERLTPAAVGLPEGNRRRTPGLRREEVALLADVGVTWYTWLEQGRDVRPSKQVLTALGDALQLDLVERRHLFALSDLQLSELKGSGPEVVEQPILRMLESLTGQSAYVLGRRWDILAWNRAAAAVFGDYSLLEGDDRNIFHMLFANKAHRELLVDWQEIATMAVAAFRAGSARCAGSPEFDRLINHLMKISPEFAEMWSRQEVVNPVGSLKRVNHPIAGRMTFEHTTFAMESSHLKLVVYTPLTEDGSAEKLESLMRASNL